MPLAGKLASCAIFFTLSAAGLASAQPARLVSTAPGVTEILYALGLGPKVVGVTTFCRYPPGAESKPKIGTFVQPDFERILAQRPDLVFIIRNPVDLGAKLRRVGLQVEELELDTVAEILASIRKAGRAAGAAEEGERLARRLAAEIEELRKATAGRPPVSALFIIDRTPGTLQGMFAAGHGSYLDELLIAAGGRNAAPAGGGTFPKISLEQVLAADPDVIFDMGDYMNGRPATPETRRRKLELWANFPDLRAVRHQRVYDVTSNQFVAPGPRLAEAARALHRMLHPASR
jgi:iron complex transport system substrate-binding protein